MIREGVDLTLIAYGHMVYQALLASDMLAREDIQAGVVNARFVKPLDETLLCQIAQQTPTLITVEESILEAGFGSAVLECYEKNRVPVTLRRAGLPGTFIEHGDRDLLLHEVSLTPQDIVKIAREEMKSKTYAR